MTAISLLVTYLVHSTLIVLGVWILQLQAGARLRDWLWKAALVLPLVTTAGHALSMEPGVGPSWRLPFVYGVASTAAPLDGRGAADSERLDALTALSIDMAALEPLALDDQVMTIAEVSIQESPLSPGVPGSGRLALWVSGALAGVLMALAIVWPGVRVRSFLRSARPVTDGPAANELARLHRLTGMVRPVRLYEHDALGSPVAAGWFRCGVYVPPRAHGLDARSRQALLAHELAHHVRLDPVWNRVTHALSIALFFQPLQRLVRARLIESAELLADDLAVRWTDDGPGLAQCLTEVCEWVQPRALASTIHSMVGAQAPTALRGRVLRALDSPREVSGALSVPVAVTLAVVAWCAMPSITSASEPAADLAADIAAPKNSNPYFAVLQRLGQQLDDLDADSRGAKDAHEHDSLRAEIDQLTRTVSQRD